MKLINIIKAVSHLATERRLPDKNESETEITSIHYNSQDVKPGGLFVAIKGLKSDGHDYIDDAIKKGAAAIIAEENSVNDSCIRIRVSCTRKALAAASAEFYNNPSSEMTVIGITGTNGKTTTSYLIEEIAFKAGLNPGVIGTVNYRYNGNKYPNPMTTPESLDLQRILSRMRQGGVTHVIMEISSHAIDLDRVYGCSIDTAVFTNLSQDHLDYHKSMEAYWDCKKRLFTEMLGDSGTAVINAENRYGRELEKLTGCRLITFGGKNPSIRVVDEDITIEGIKALISIGNINFRIKTPAIGRHNLENIQNAIGAAIASDMDHSAIISGIETFNVPGRLEKVQNSKEISVFVDYAHTPDALLNVLETVRPLTGGRVICLFGCGGDRDRSKRAKMAQIAENGSDIIIITSDNPRTEDPQNIIDDILEGISCREYSGPAGEYKGIEKIHITEPDRRLAIQYAIMTARPKDTVIIAGKGHETYQITGSGKIDFDDRKEAEEAFKAYDT